MRRYYVLILLLILSLSCNLVTPSQQATPIADVSLGTIVARTLTAQLSSTMPTLMKTQVQVTPTSTTTPTLENTSTVTPTPTITMTTTLSATKTPAGPRASLGTPTWKSTFNKDDAGFYTKSDDHTLIKIENSALVLTSTMITVGWHGWSMQNRKLGNFYLEGTFEVGNCSGSDRYGLIFHAPDYSSGYFFGVSCDGKYSLSALTTDFSTIVDWTASADILSGSNRVNRLGVMVKGTHISLYINDKLVKEVDDNTFPKEGVFGVYIAAYETAGFTFKLDEIDYWKLN